MSAAAVPSVEPTGTHTRIQAVTASHEALCCSEPYNMGSEESLRSPMILTILFLCPNCPHFVGRCFLRFLSLWLELLLKFSGLPPSGHIWMGGGWLTYFSLWVAVD